MLQSRSAGLVGFGLHETEPASTVQEATFRGGDHRPVCPLVPAISAQLSAVKEIMAERNPESFGTEAEWRTRSALQCRPVRYLNNIVEQDHRAVNRRVRASQGFRALHSAWRTLQGIETMNMIRKGQVRWLPKNDAPGQAAFIERLFGLTTP